MGEAFLFEPPSSWPDGVARGVYVFIVRRCFGV